MIVPSRIVRPIPSRVPILPASVAPTSDPALDSANVIPIVSLVSGALASTIGLRPTMFIGTTCCLLAVLPIALSEVRNVKELPTEPEELPVTEEALLPTEVAGLSPETPGS